ncbi:MAG: hypothetical protein AAGE61_00205 [Pseudomonadota bacterium]
MSLARASAWHILMLALILSPYCSPVGAEDSLPGYEIALKGKKTSFNTHTGKLTIRGISRKGLVSAQRRSNLLLSRYFEDGGFRETVELNGEILVDGRDTSDIARVSGFRTDRDGSFVYVRITKGPDGQVTLVQDGDPVLTWRRNSRISILSYDRKSLVTAEYDQARQRTVFLRYMRLENGRISSEPQPIGALEDCALLGARITKTSIIAQTYCDPSKGSDLVEISLETGEQSGIAAGSADEMISPIRPREKGAISVLTIDGNPNGKQAFHAIAGLFLSSLGEPMSLASDEAGRQSWAQSYRTRTLGLLFEKTGHPVFASLATRAMTNTLMQDNRRLGLTGPFNPSCAWASRIYSQDGKSPVSFLVNQAMIASALTRTCERLGTSCPSKLKAAIERKNRCLIAAYEPHFDHKHGLYRIQYGAPFRFDGIWAPWNWQMSLLPVLVNVARSQENDTLKNRAASIANRFVESWSEQENGVTWRYWPRPYYDGWQSEDRISQNRPEQRTHIPKRFEDTNHAGISLLGLADSGYRNALPESMADGLTRRIDTLIEAVPGSPRDLDGQGPRSPQWIPGGGFAAFATDELDKLYAAKLPASVSSDQHLAYAMLFDPKEPFDLRIELRQCDETGCSTRVDKRYNSVSDFLSDNPLFTIRRLKTGR